MVHRALLSPATTCRNGLLLTSFWLLVALWPAARTLSAQTADDFQSRLKEALDLYDKGRFVDAAPLFQRLDEIHPDNAVVKEHLGTTLFALAATKGDSQEATQLRIRARECLLDARALGDKSNLVQVAIDQIPEDGHAPTYSSHNDVDSAMKSGEAAFANGDLDQALESYEWALILDPKQYYAALFIGDVHYRRKEVEQAGIWFARAIAIEPDTETAYRYWGDTLAQSQRYGEAVEKYVDAVVAEPYSRKARTGLIQFAQSRKVTLKEPHIASPNSHQVEGNDTKIAIDPTTLDKKDGASSWVAYDLERALWHGEKFKKEYPEETSYRHSLKEDAEALSLVADSVEEQMKDKKITNLDPTLALLLKLKQEGLIEAYVLVSAADEGIAKDLPPYRATHRELLHRYVEEYIAAPLVKAQ